MESSPPTASTSYSRNGNTINENTVSSSSPRLSDDNGFDPIRTCGTCKGSVQDKSSKLLACLHTVCAPCHIARTSGGEFECSVCFIKSPSSVIVENFVAHGLDANSKPTIKCNNEMCTDNAIAKVHCAQCEEDLCARCKDAHQRVKVFRDHQIIPVMDGRAVGILPTVCQKHPHEELSLFCTRCKILTCRDCQLSQEHAGHHEEHMSLHDAVMEMRTKLATLANNALAKIKILESHHQSAMSRIRSVEERRELYKMQIREAAQMMINMLKSRVNELGGLIDQACSQQQQSYLSLTAPLEQIIAMGKQFAHFSNAAASLKDKHALLHSAQYLHAPMDLMNKRDKACNMNILQKAGQRMDLQLPTQDLADRIAAFGTFIYEQQDAASTSGSAASNPGASSPSPACRPVHHPPMQAGPRQRHPQQTAPSHQQLSTKQPTLLGSILTSRQHEQRHQSSPGLLTSPVGVMGQNAYAQGMQRPPRQSQTVSSADAPPNICVAQQPPVPFFQRMVSPQQQMQFQFQAQQPFNGGYHAGLQHAAFAGARHNSPPAMAASPSGVSSTSVTPPGGYCNGQQDMLGSDQRQVTLTANPYHQCQIPPPPLYSAIQEFNSQTSGPHDHLLRQLHQAHRLQLQRPQSSQMGQSSIFPDANIVRQQMAVPAQPIQHISQQQSVPHNHARSNVPMMPNLMPAPVPGQQQQRRQSPCRLQADAPRNRQAVSGDTIHLSIQPDAPVLRADVAPVKSLENGPRLQSAVFGLVEVNDGSAIPGLIRLLPDDGDAGNARANQLLNAMPNVSAISPAVESTTAAPAEALEQSTLDLVPISPATIDRALATFEKLSQLEDMAAALSPSLEEPVKTPSKKPEQPTAMTQPTTVVSSTTTDAENALVENTPIANGVASAPPENPVPIRRMARKTIATSRQLVDLSRGTATAEISSDASTSRTHNPSLTLNNDTGVSNTVTSTAQSGRIATSPLNLSESTNGSEARRPSDDIKAIKTDKSSASLDAQFDEFLDDVKPQDSARSWDDYCAVCNNGGELVCCEGPGCRRVFHRDHHIPELERDVEDRWICSFCIDLEKCKRQKDQVSRDERDEMTDYELKACQRILLTLYTHQESLAFHDPVDEHLTEYFDVITHPMDFSVIRSRLHPRSHDFYKRVKQFIHDLNQIFMNCDEFNSAERDPNLRWAGVVVGEEYLNLVRTYFPDLVRHVKLKKSAKRRLSRSSSNDSVASSSKSSVRRRRVVVQDDDE